MNCCDLLYSKDKGMNEKKKEENMLQIISGKFYQNKEIYNNPTQMFLYSNANIENEFEIVGIKIK